MSAKCTFQVINGTVMLNITELSEPINSFFQINFPDFMSPRSPTPYSSFEFYSFDQDEVLNFQTQDILAFATEYERVQTLQIQSSS